jgi:hypothetical protein
VNETELLRGQLAIERAHASAVANASASALHAADGGALGAGGPLAEFRDACVSYLVCVLAWFEERDQRLSDLVRLRLEAGGPVRRALEEALARPGRSREVLERLEAAVNRSPSGWAEFAQYFNGVWSARRDTIDTLFAFNAHIGDWRAVAGIDADSILEEKQRYASVAERLPDGASLAAAPAQSGSDR